MYYEENIDETEYNKKTELINYYSNAKSYENLRKTCLDALEHDPHNAFVLTRLVYAYYSLLGNNDSEEMITEFIKTAEKALMNIKNTATRAYIFNLLGYVYSYYCSNHSKSLECFKQAVECVPERGEYLGNYAVELARLGNTDEAATLLNRAEELSPQNYFVLQAKQIFLYNFRHDRKAEEETLSCMLQLSSEPFYTYIHFGDFHYKYGEYQKAYNYFVKAALVNPKHKNVRERLQELENRGYGINENAE